MLAGRPPFITIEGGEGAGKSTQARLLAGSLAAAGHAVLRTREPGGAPGAEALRGMLLHGTQDWTPLAETLLHFAARAEHVARTILPALNAGMSVVCDRFYDSTMAYQAGGAGAPPDTVRSLRKLIDLQPDLTLMLHVSPEMAAARLVGRKLAPDRYERQDAQFHGRVDRCFRAIAAAEPARCCSIDADASMSDVHAAVLAAVGERLRCLR